MHHLSFGPRPDRGALSQDSAAAGRRRSPVRPCQGGVVGQDGPVDPVRSPSGRAGFTPSRRRRPAGVVLVVVGDLLVVVGAFLPWVLSGEAKRDSFATVRAAQRIGVVG